MVAAPHSEGDANFGGELRQLRKLEALGKLLLSSGESGGYVRLRVELAVVHLPCVHAQGKEWQSHSHGASPMADAEHSALLVDNIRFPPA